MMVILGHHYVVSGLILGLKNTVLHKLVVCSFLGLGHPVAGGLLLDIRLVIILYRFCFFDGDENLLFDRNTDFFALRFNSLMLSELANCDLVS